MERWITLAALLYIHSSVGAIEVVETFCVVVACKLSITTRLYTMDWLSDKNLSLRFALSLRRLLVAALIFRSLVHSFCRSVITAAIVAVIFEYS